MVREDNEYSRSRAERWTGEKHPRSRADLRATRERDSVTLWFCYRK